MTRFAEMVAATNYSFLRGASDAGELVAAAIDADLEGIGIADRNTVSGVVRVRMAIKFMRERLKDVYEEIDFPLELQNIDPDDKLPWLDFRMVAGARLVFADGTPDIVAYPATRHGWGRLTRLLTTGNRRALKGDCILHVDDLLDHLDDLLLIVMPTTHFTAYGEVGARPHPKWLEQVAQGEVSSPFATKPQPRLSLVETIDDPGFLGGVPVARILSRLSRAAPDRVWLGATMPRVGQDRRRLDNMAALARRTRVPLLATCDVLYATPDQRPLHDVVTCIREGVKIEEAGTRLAVNAERHIKERQEMIRLFGEHAGAIDEAVRLFDRIDFDLRQLEYEYPHEPVPKGWAPQDWLEELVWEYAHERYGSYVPARIVKMVREEFKLVKREQYSYYFLTVHDVVCFARSRGILCQGRGSAANSVICFLLGITSVDPMKHQLLFSRFISDDRKEPPDIDVDFEHERREEVMQYIYRRYGRDRAGIAATTIHYRPRSAVREVAKVLGLSEDIASRIGSTVWGSYAADMGDMRYRQAGLDPANGEVAKLSWLVGQLLQFPRHLSQHVGGFVLTEGRLDELVPIHNAAMDDRTFIEWDKDDIDELRLMKVDVLALGMLTCIRKAFALIDTHLGKQYLLDTIPDNESGVYDMLCEGESLGVFQVESRAQINMLPRLKPRELYDLTIQVAIVRPGPIQGGMVHPYLRRRMKKERVDYPSPGPDHDPNELRAVLEKTLGVPLFQEQAMKLAIVAAGFTPSEANQLRRAMATFRNVGTISQLREKMVGGMIRRGYDPAFAKACFKQIEGFGSYGFPESHAQSFARLVYVSSYIKWRYPAVFACALLNSQPMGFYAPAQIIDDARKNGVGIRPADINASSWDNILEAPFERLDGETDEEKERHWSKRRARQPHLRIGLRQIDGFSEKWAERIAEARVVRPFTSVEELARRAGLPGRAMRLLADADAFRSIGLDRRKALWEVRRLPTGALPLFDFARAAELGAEPDMALPDMPLSEEVAADYQVTRLSLKGHPMQFLRPLFAGEGVLSCKEADQAKNGRRVRVAGVVLVRQRPGEGKAIFITIEDETGIVNVLLWARIFENQRRQVMSARLMEVEGEIQRSPEGVVHLMGATVIDRTVELGRLSEDHRPSIEPLRADVFAHPQLPRHAAPRGRHPRDVRILPPSRDFH